MPIVPFPSLNDVPEEFRSKATPISEGSEEVQVNLVLKESVDEFRENNISLSKERDTLKNTATMLQAIVGDNPDEFKTELESLRTTNQRVADGELKENTSIETEVVKRTEEMRSVHESQLTERALAEKAWQSKFEATDSLLRRTYIDRAVSDALSNADLGARPEAYPDFLHRAYGVFTADENGNVVAKDGDAIIYGADGTKPLSMLEWMTSQQDPSPHLFKASNGGGADGASDQLSVNGMQTEEFNALSASQRLARINEK